MQDVLDRLSRANPERSLGNLNRRVIKLQEELGEVCEAYLQVTSAHNSKAKTWDDVREEFADVVIVACDIALTFDPDPGFLASWLPYLDEPCSVEDFADLSSSLGHDLGLCKLALRHGQDGLANLHAQNMVQNAVLLALTALPDRPDAEVAEITTALIAEMNRKLGKWEAQRAARTSATMLAED